MSPSERPQLFLLLGGAAVLTILSAAQLPPPRELLRRPTTPFDHTGPISAAADFRLLSEAASVVPIGSSVSVVAEPRDAARETLFHRVAVGLLPGRKIIPAALWNVPTSEEVLAEFRIVVGPRPAVSPGALILETPLGSVWRNRR